jgi:hypothetical protein
VVLHMLANVQQITIQPIIKATVAKGALVHTDEYGVAVAAKLCLARSSPPWSYDPDQHPGSQQESTASSRWS